VKTLVGNVLGAFLAFVMFAYLARVSRSKETAITCGWCGQPVLMKTALEGGIGAVNAEMRAHMVECVNHPMHEVKLELNDARAAMKVIFGLAEYRPFDPLQRTPGERLEAIRDLAGRNSHA
jgi:hypothetical protein